ncbi:MAG: M20/M25/M40 family metallo-hydrolase [Nitrososphaeria archaeon]|nr:M20/M25/M40 family metallo-hydrolase [Nitrososphaeria archaeon]
MNNYISLLYEMVKFYTPSGKEERLALFIKDKLQKEFNADKAYIDRAGNAIGVYEGKEPSILLCGHMDTVPGEIEVKMDEEYIYGRGAVDAKSSLAAFLSAANELRKSGFKNRLIIAAVVDEEDTGKGIKNLIEEGEKVSYAVFGEPSSSTNIVIGYRGGVRVRLEFRTESYHASSIWLGKSAVEAAIEVWENMRKYNEEAFSKEKKFDTITVCLTKMSGGESHNMSPSYCEMVLDIRFPPKIKYENIIKELTDITSKVCGQKIEYKISVEDYTPPYIAPIKNELIEAFKHGVKKVKGIEAQLVRKTGSGDMNIYGNIMKTPTITYGPGDPKLAHTPYEKISLKEYLESIDILKEALTFLSKSF